MLNIYTTWKENFLEKDKWGLNTGKLSKSLLTFVKTEFVMVFGKYEANKIRNVEYVKILVFGKLKL